MSVRSYYGGNKHQRIDVVVKSINKGGWFYPAFFVAQKKGFTLVKPLRGNIFLYYNFNCFLK